MLASEFDYALCRSFSHLDFQVKIDVSVKFHIAPKRAPINLDINQFDEKPNM